jgi:hypothetical protein
MWGGFVTGPTHSSGPLKGDRLARMDYLANYDPSDESWAAPGDPRQRLR